MRIEIDKTYVKYSIYTIITATILYVLYGIISNLDIILKAAWMILEGVLSLLAPLIIALVITYLLHPLVSWIESMMQNNIKWLAPDIHGQDKRHNLRRTFCVLITYCFFLALIVLFIYGLYILVSGSLPRNLALNGMVTSIAAYSNTYQELFDRITTYLQTSAISEGIKNQLLGLIDATQNFISGAGAGLFGSLQKFGNNLFNVIIGFVLAFYLLKDINYFKALYHEILKLVLNSRRDEKLSVFLADINRVVSSFIRGQLLAAFIVGILSSLALYLIGLDYALFIGMTAGIGNIIPYVGPILGSAIAVLVALLGGNLFQALLAVIALILVQQIDGNIISPKIVGDSVGLHPVFIMLSLIIGGSLFGLIGMIIAVPVTGIIKLILTRWTANHIQNWED